MRCGDVLNPSRVGALGDRADQLDDLVAGHADAVVPDGQRALLLVDIHIDVQVGRVDLEILVDE